MDAHTLASVGQFSDDDLVARVKSLAGRERAATAVLIAHLTELDRRRLYLAEGCASLFTYCTQVLHLSEHAAYGRIEAARAVRRFPVILERLEEGSVTLTTVGLLAAHLTPENHRDLLDRARHQSKRQVEELIAQLHPQPPVPPSIRRLPAASHASGSPAGSDGATDSGHPHGDAQGVDSSGMASAAIMPGPPLSPRPARPAIVRPLAPQRYRVQFTASAETVEKLRLAQALLRHQIPDGDPAQIVDLVLTVLLQDLAKKKLAATDRPHGTTGTARGSPPVTRGPRHVPAEVKRAVWVRDGGRCAFIGRHGRRCTEEGFLEFHHVVAHCMGGKSMVENIQLRCRAHNGYEAEVALGLHKSPVVKEARAAYGHPSEPTCGPPSDHPGHSVWTECRPRADHNPGKSNRVVNVSVGALEEARHI